MNSLTRRFGLSPQPELLVEPGAFRRLVTLLKEKGFSRPVLVTGGRSVRGRDDWGVLLDSLVDGGYSFLDFTVRGEPGPDVVNAAVAQIRTDAPDTDVVVAVGGGSALDAGKAIAFGAARDRHGAFDVTRYLEGVGDTAPDGMTLPVIAVPTTAGTGTEATKNAVISRVGPGGFKKSLRHERFVPRFAIIDVDLHQGCPPEIARAAGLDAITQLLESYLSTGANPLTDALALTGLRHAGRAFPLLIRGEDTAEVRTEMAIAAYLSGVCLASAGLGAVHALASPAGAAHDIPHGVFCGLLVGPMTAATLASTGKQHRDDTRTRYLAVARALGLAAEVEALMETLQEWAAPLPRLGSFGFSEKELDAIASQGGLKTHPVELDEREVTAVLREVL
jgi:alcohol dehydrogenase class IV